MPFEYRTESEEYGRSLLELASKAHKLQLLQYVSKENLHDFKHGRGWLTVRDSSVDQSCFETSSVDLSMEYESLRNYDVQAMFDFLKSFVEGFSSQAIQKMFQKISEACDAHGNTISSNDHASPAEAFLEMLKKIEFSVDANGQVALPEIHVGVGGSEPLMQSIEEQGPEFQAEIEKIKQQKSQEALEKEKARLNKYKGVQI